MVKRIYKYPLAVTDRQPVIMPDGAQILAVQTQNEWVCLWAIVDDEAPKVKRVFEIIGTGHDIMPAERTYIGTTQMAGGALVWHVFELQT